MCLFLHTNNNPNVWEDISVDVANDANDHNNDQTSINFWENKSLKLNMHEKMIHNGILTMYE